MSASMEIQDPMVRALAMYISSAVFQRQFEQFFLDNALSFTDELEHQLEYMTIYIAFQHKFNEHMEGFLAEQGVTEDEFTARFQKAIRSDPKAEQYLDIVLASMDYDAFYGLMKAMRSRAALESGRADAKSSAGADERDAKGGGSGKRKAADGARNDEDVAAAAADDDDGRESKDAVPVSARGEAKTAAMDAGEKQVAPEGGESKERASKDSK